MPPPSLDQLRQRIAALEGVGPEAVAGVLPLGLPEIDAVLPWGGIALGGLHEMVPTLSPDGGEDGAALGFAAFWMARLAAGRGKPVLWVAARDDLYPPGLAALGLDPAQLVMVRPGRSAHLAWTIEQGLACRGLAGVLGEVWGLEPTAARRLQLAARTSGVTALLLNRGEEGCGPALTRWRVSSAPSQSLPEDGVGAWRWEIALTRCCGRGVGEEGGVAAWLVEWNDETHSLRMAAAAADRPAVPRRTALAG